MITVLFVDDEPHILSGLQRLLRPLRHEWEMCFVTSGAEALALLAEKRVDVIVSDMRMPDMDGAQLLTAVSSRYPQIIRLILSGHAEQNQLLRSVKVTHRYVAKPCDTDALKLIITQACALQGILNNEQLRQLVAPLKTIPSLPSLYTQVMHELQRPEPSLKAVAATIQQDIGMTVKILQIINSAFFSVQRDIAEVSEAVALLGLETISALVLGVGIFAQFQGTPQQHIIDGLWAHCIAVAKKAKIIASSEAPACAAAAFTAGLLHKIGQLVFVVNAPKEYFTIQGVIEQGHLTQAIVEQQIMGEYNALIGAYLLELWGLPKPIVEAVAFQHQPNGYPSNSFTALTAVHVAKALVSHPDGDILTSPEQYLDSAYLTRLQLWDKVPIWYAAGMKAQSS